jgi:8-oxo-dGTP pyrophosphatase MutT (NUDIX family)
MKDELLCINYILHLPMLKKIYFGNKPLFISDERTEEIKPFLNDTNTVVTKDLKKDDLQSTIIKMQEAKTNAGIILYKMPDAFDTVKKHFTLIQARGGLVFNGNKILLIFRRGKWDLPKGKLDEGENLAECALREIKEETGINNISFEQTLCITYHTYFENGKHILKESHWHLIKGNDAEVLIPQIDEDIEKCEWVNTNQLAPYIDNAPASVIDVIKEGLKVLKEKQRLNQAIN